eukprot:130996-Amphidinium_carterae.1
MSPPSMSFKVRTSTLQRSKTDMCSHKQFIIHNRFVNIALQGDKNLHYYTESTPYRATSRGAGLPL